MDDVELKIKKLDVLINVVNARYKFPRVERNKKGEIILTGATEISVFNDKEVANYKAKIKELIDDVIGTTNDEAPTGESEGQQGKS